ncbi:MAG TPA: 2-C-methyl-D-erythritol 4-phosphate cytidylyltransferase [Bacteroidia bacterium]|jgi:2-C-methyl-D-erythritol 4-phosphate cytidylyltransferase
MTEKLLRKYAIIVAGGSGTRMLSPVPKQFLKLNGLPVLMHTIRKFDDLRLGIEIILVLPKANIVEWQDLCREFNFTVPLCIAEGGETRFHSVKNGLALIKEEGIVAVHDAVRPLVSPKTILAAFRDAEMYGNAVPAIPLNDSIRQIESSKSIAVDRARYCVIQTPQCFTTEILRKAYLKEYKFSFTDDATVVESIGEKIHLIDGSSDNIKITTPQDLVVAEALLKYVPLLSKDGKR